MNDLTYINLQPGDIILVGDPGAFYDFIIPGPYAHVFIYCGRVSEEQPIWDRDNWCWMPVNTPYVIHSSASNHSQTGLGFSSWVDRVNSYGVLIQSIRVIGVNISQRLQALEWMISKLSGGPDGYPIGPEYDQGWTQKQIEGINPRSNVDGYYCSEIVWAAYKDLFQIDLDPDGEGWDTATFYGISPTELLESPHTERLEMYFGSIPQVGEHSITNCSYNLWVDANNDTMFLESELIHYKNEIIWINTTVLPKGFIQGISGLTINECKTFQILEEPDANGDLINDDTGQTLFGILSGEFTNKSLKYEVLIHCIDGINLFDLPTESELHSNSTNWPSSTDPIDQGGDNDDYQDHIIPGYYSFLPVMGILIVVLQYMTKNETDRPPK